MKTVTAKEMAQLLNGREYGDEMTTDMERLAKDSGLLIVFGYSDDNMEFRGILSDEVGCYDGRAYLFDAEGVLPNWDDIEDEKTAEDYFRRKKQAKSIEAIWDQDGYSWTYKTDVPHETFDILEDGEKYCRGIVIHKDDLA